MAHAKKKSGKPNPKGTKKKDAIHGLKKGKKGDAAAYITRAQALSKLSISLADFRKLCILKGIYPRDPKKKAQGNDKTYYHVKDIKFLTHEPLLNKFFELKTFMKKFKRLLGRGEYKTARGFEERKPTYTLSHLVRERYSTFEDALRDLDDGLSMLALFQALPADQLREIPKDAIDESTRLYQEFQLYCIRAQSLRKVFASIKGYYFQAEVHGVTITWLAPHQFAQQLPEEVDFRVMLTFLEFYRTVLKFVNFKLYGELGLAYPPKRDQKRDSVSAEVAALEVEMKAAGKEQEKAKEESDRQDAEVSAAVAADFGTESAEALEMQALLKEKTRMKTTFRGLKVFINREVPLRPIYFVLLCGGVAEVGWERGASNLGAASQGSAFSAEGKDITHQIIDRPAEQLSIQQGREYIQPQWVFDSFNMGCLLPVALYAPGRSPPPHLSPFTDDKAEGYVPRQRELLDQLAREAGVAMAEGVSATASASSTAAPAGPANDLDRFNAELRAEQAGVWASSFKEKSKEERNRRALQAQAEEEEEILKDDVKGEVAELRNPGLYDLTAAPAEPSSEKPTEEEEEKLRGKALMSKKHKRLLQRIEKSENNKKEANGKLLKKRRRMELEEQKRSRDSSV